MDVHARLAELRQAVERDALGFDPPAGLCTATLPTGTSSDGTGLAWAVNPASASIDTCALDWRTS